MLPGLDSNYQPFYRYELRLWLNLFLPSVEPVKKMRERSKVRRVYGAARTPLERVKACAQAGPEKVPMLEEMRKRLDPFQLSRPASPRPTFAWVKTGRRRGPSKLGGA